MVSSKTAFYFPATYQADQILLQHEPSFAGREDIPQRLIEYVIELAVAEFSKLTKSVDQRI